MVVPAPASSFSNWALKSRSTTSSSASAAGTSVVWPQYGHFKERERGSNSTFAPHCSHGNSLPAGGCRGSGGSGGGASGMGAIRDVVGTGTTCLAATQRGARATYACVARAPRWVAAKHEHQCGSGGGWFANSACSSGTVSAAAQLGIPAFHTSDVRVTFPSRTFAAIAARSNGPAAAPSIAAW